MQVFYKCFIQKLYKTVISIVKVKLKITLYTDKLTEVDCDNKIFDIHL